VIDVQDLSLPTFNALLQYLYSGLPEITEDNVVELLMISNQYALTHLQELCECYVEKGIYKDNAAYILGSLRSSPSLSCHLSLQSLPSHPPLCIQRWRTAIKRTTCAPSP
jgi:hypothetical protein